MNKLLFIFFSLPLFVLGQKVDLSAYKYVYINPLNHQRVDATYGITSSIASAFTSKGLIVANYFSENNVPQDLKSNPCLLLKATPLYIDGAFSMKLRLDIVNCNSEKVFSKEVSATAMVTVDEAYTKATKKMVKEIDRIRYSFNASLTPQYKIAVNPNYRLANTGLTEDSIKRYFDKSKLDPIEGIYKSYHQADDNSPTYKFAVMKKALGQYQAVIIDAETSIWKAGEVKMILENTAMSDMFSIQYYMQDKSKMETFASFSNNIIKIDFTNAQKSKENAISSFIKTYPFNSSFSIRNISIGGNGSDLVATGTGFIISDKGLLVTNYHVISIGSRFTATNTENGKIYELELMQKDKTNDIAILKIKNLEQKLPSIPYKLSSKAKVGQNVFTIGYPLNNVMGNNQKVTNGIINALTGMQDDSRYYQISVPIQPGNSGGALFDMKGNLIGITTATLNPEVVNTNVQNVNYAIKVSLLQNLISILPDEEQIQISNSEESNELPLSLLSDKYKMFVFKISTYK